MYLKKKTVQDLMKKMDSAVHLSLKNSKHNSAIQKIIDWKAW